MNLTNSYDDHINRNRMEETMKILDPHEISENHTSAARRLDKIHRQETVQRALKSERYICSDDLDNHFKILGQYLSDCIFDEKSYSDDIDTEKILAFILSNQNAIEALVVLQEVIEEELIQNIIIKEKKDHERGVGEIRINLQEQLALEEIGEIEYEFKLFIAERWFENYSIIHEIRLQKAGKLITWEEMETRINELLQINHD